MKRKTRGILTALLGVALALVAVLGVTRTAQAETTTWSESFTTEGGTIEGGVTLTADVTLTIPEGVTLTVNGGGEYGYGIDTGGKTLTVTGGGTLIVNGSKVGFIPLGRGIHGDVTVDGASITVNGAQGVDNGEYGAKDGGDGIQGSLTVISGSATVKGGDGVYQGDARGGEGGSGVYGGNVTVKSGSVTITGGNGGGSGGTLSTTGGGGAGGKGIVMGNLVVEGGSAAVTGGNGGAKSGSAAMASDGYRGNAVIGGTITGTTRRESDDGESWADISGETSKKQYVQAESPVTVAVTKVTLSPSDAQTVDVGGKVSFTATIEPTDATDKKVKWSVGGDNPGAVKLYSNEACTAEVGSDATETLTVYAKGVSAGTATVTCTATNGTETTEDDKTATCDVTVSAAAAPATLTVGTIWKNGETIDLGTGWFYYNVDEQDERYCGNGSNTVIAFDSNQKAWTYSTSSNQFFMARNGTDPEYMIVLNSGPSKLWLEIPSGKDEKDAIGIKLVSGKGTQAEPYKFELAFNASTISQTVTFKVVNGKWADDSTEDKTVTLTGYEGDTLKLAANQIPAVGSKPSDTYKAGSWDVTPSTDTAITADTTYTYTYAQKEAATVTKAPEAKTLTYTGSAQELVTAGTATGGEMQYALGTNATTAPDASAYTTSIPTATEAGTYTVWYKVVGDANHNDTEPQKVTSTIAKPADADALTGSGHVQNYGDVAARASGKGIVIGTTGEAKRLEQFSLALPKDTNGGIEYRAHLQGKGWGDWVQGGKPCGTTGESRRMEAVQLRLTGKVAETHSVWYRVHSQTYGWLGWARDGEAAGTAGQSKRAEAVEVQVLPKGEAPEGHEAGQASYVGAATADVHLQRTGWAGARSALEFGTTGQSRRLEAMKLALADQPLEGGITYSAHLQGTGWTGAVSDGALAGTTGQARRLEAVRINLTGDLASSYSVWYRVHSQTNGWLGWAHDGEVAGTTGLSKRAEAIDVQVLPQGQLPRGYDASKAACVNG